MALESELLGTMIWLGLFYSALAFAALSGHEELHCGVQVSPGQCPLQWLTLNAKTALAHSSHTPHSTELTSNDSILACAFALVCLNGCELGMQIIDLLISWLTLSIDERLNDVQIFFLRTRKKDVIYHLRNVKGAIMWPIFTLANNNNKKKHPCSNGSHLHCFLFCYFLFKEVVY